MSEENVTASVARRRIELSVDTWKQIDNVAQEFGDDFNTVIVACVAEGLKGKLERVKKAVAYSHYEFMKDELQILKDKYGFE